MSSHALRCADLGCAALCLLLLAGAGVVTPPWRVPGRVVVIDVNVAPCARSAWPCVLLNDALKWLPA